MIQKVAPQYKDAEDKAKQEEAARQKEAERQADLKQKAKSREQAEASAKIQEELRKQAQVKMLPALSLADRALSPCEVGTFQDTALNSSSLFSCCGSHVLIIQH